MGYGTSILLIAVGAVLRFAVTATTSGINLQTVGVILMIVGIVGLLFTVLWMTMYADRRRERRYVERPVATDAVVRERDAY